MTRGDKTLDLEHLSASKVSPGVVSSSEDPTDPGSQRTEGGPMAWEGLSPEGNDTDTLPVVSHRVTGVRR